MDERIAKLMAKLMTECYASEQGCKRIPVRMLTEVVAGDVADAQIVMLCVDHAAVYKPEGRVIQDQTISDEQVKFLVEHGL